MEDKKKGETKENGTYSTHAISGLSVPRNPRTRYSDHLSVNVSLFSEFKL